MTDVSTTTTIGDVVAGDLRSAAVFARYGIDFCCGGRRSIEDACRSRGISPEIVLRDLESIAHRHETAQSDDMTTWPLDRVIDHIVTNHHSYVRRQIAVIQAYVDKLAAKKSERFPAMRQIAEGWTALAEELARHLDKEEAILFPAIRALFQASAEGEALPRTPFGTIQNPVRVMELEHVHAGNGMWQVRQLTNNYQPPADACVTWRACYAELEAFERDLHLHVHLENNILFPAAARLEEHFSRRWSSRSCSRG